MRVVLTVGIGDESFRDTRIEVGRYMDETIKDELFVILVRMERFC